VAYPNRYQGNCKHCDFTVDAQKGFYSYGSTTCSEEIGVEAGMETVWHCLRTFNRTFGTNFASADEAGEFELQRRHRNTVIARERMRATLVGGELQQLAATAKVRSLAQVIAKVTGTSVDVADLTWEQARDVRVELDKRIRRKESAKVLDDCKKTNTCNRCGGAGGADKWQMTGWTCYQCGGTGKYYPATA
jgi:hypothetical protein